MKHAVSCEQQTFGRPQLTGRGTMPQATVTCEKLSAARTVMVGIGLAGGLRHLSAMRFLTVGRVMSPDLSLTSTLDWFESFPSVARRFRQLCESTSMLPKVSNSTKRSYSRKHRAIGRRGR